MKRRRSVMEALERRMLLSYGALVEAVQDLGSTVGADAADPVRDVAYVVDQNGTQILAVNTDTGTTAGIATAAADVSGLTVSLDDTRLFASEPGAFQIEVFSLPSMQLLTTLDTGEAVNQIVAIANDRIAGMANGIQIFDAETGDALYSLPASYDGLIRTDAAGTTLYSRARGLSGNDGGISDWDVSGTGAPVSLPEISGPVGANSFDFQVDPVAGHAYMSDGGGTGSIEVTLLSDGNLSDWDFDGGGPAESISTLDGGPYIYALSTNGRVLQFNENGVELAYLNNLPETPYDQDLIITPNNHLVWEYGSGIGVVGITSLNITTTPQLVFAVPPAAGVTGAAVPVVVDLEDAGGNIVSGDDSDVTLSTLSGPGSPSVLATIAAQNGVATFSNIAFADAGTYSVQATDGSYSSVTSDSFTISNLVAPANVSASMGTFPRHVQIAWSAAAGAASYQVFRNTTNNLNSATKIGGAITNDYFNDTTAVAGTLYYYWVRDRNPGLIGPYGSDASGYLPLAAPVGVSATNNLPHHVAVTWDAVGAASNYQIFRSTTNDPSTATKIAGGITTTFFDDTTAVAGVNYFYWVRARNAAGFGLMSASAEGSKLLQVIGDTI